MLEKDLVDELVIFQSPHIMGSETRGLAKTPTWTELKDRRALNIEDVAPPPKVADAFDEVQRAEQDEDKFQEEAQRYRAQILGQARGEAAQIREDAAAYKNRVVEEAKGEAQRFLSVYEQYVTRSKHHDAPYPCSL